MFKRLDIPAVPEEIILPLDEILKLKNFFGGYTDKYTIHDCQDELYFWLKDVFPEYNKLCYQTLQDDVPIHIDGGRTTAINYIIKSGGDSVSTAWYDSEFGEKINEISIEPNQWHEIEVDKWHTVHGITDRRISITVY
jgi:hypothetical protein